MNFWIETTKVIGPIISPFIALAGAIYLYFKKQQSDRDDVRRKERLDAYSDTLSEINQAWTIALNEPYPKMDADLAKVRYHLNRLHVIAPPEVYRAAWTVQNKLAAVVLASIDAGKDWQKQKMAGAFDALVLEIRVAEHMLINLMRSDVGPILDDGHSWREQFRGAFEKLSTRAEGFRLRLRRKYPFHKLDQD